MNLKDPEVPLTAQDLEAAKTSWMIMHREVMGSVLGLIPRWDQMSEMAQREYALRLKARGMGGDY